MSLYRADVRCAAETREAIERRFVFESFVDAFAFMTQTALEAEKVRADSDRGCVQCVAADSV